MTKATVTVDAEVVRGVNSDRLTMLGVLVGIALTVAFGVQGLDWYLRVVLGAAMFFGIATLCHIVFRYERPRHAVMAFAHWILGRQL
jgi:hypothetical protein